MNKSDIITPNMYAYKYYGLIVYFHTKGSISGTVVIHDSSGQYYNGETYGYWNIMDYPYLWSCVPRALDMGI